MIDLAAFFVATQETLADLLGVYQLEDGAVPAIDWYTADFTVLSVAGLEVILADTMTELECSVAETRWWTGKYEIYLNDYNPSNPVIHTAASRLLAELPNHSKAYSNPPGTSSQIRILSMVVVVDYQWCDPVQML